MLRGVLGRLRSLPFRRTKSGSPFHGLVIGTPSPKRPEMLKKSKMEALYFTCDFVNNHSEYKCMVPYCVEYTPLGEDGSRPGSASWVEATLPLKSNVIMREALISFIGKKVRYGKLFEVIDALAADTCYKHIGLGEDAEIEHRLCGGQWYLGGMDPDETIGEVEWYVLTVTSPTGTAAMALRHRVLEVARARCRGLSYSVGYLEWLRQRCEPLVCLGWLSLAVLCMHRSPTLTRMD